jgi:hypothetical protein
LPGYPAEIVLLQWVLDQDKAFSMKKKQEPGRRNAGFVSRDCFKNTVDSDVLADAINLAQEISTPYLEKQNV